MSFQYRAQPSTFVRNPISFRVVQIIIDFYHLKMANLFKHFDADTLLSRSKLFSKKKKKKVPPFRKKRFDPQIVEKHRGEIERGFNRVSHIMLGFSPRHAEMAHLGVNVVAVVLRQPRASELPRHVANRPTSLCPSLFCPPPFFLLLSLFLAPRSLPFIVGRR